MKRYFINHKTDALTTETDPEQIDRYFASGYTELTEEEYNQEYARIWANLVFWRD